MVTGWEKLTVDDRVIFSGFRWTIVSRYPFQIGSHSCEAILRSGLDMTSELMVDGAPFELLPERALLRASSAPGEAADELLRAPNNTGNTRPEELLRPSQPDESAQ